MPRNIFSMVLALGLYLHASAQNSPSWADQIIFNETNGTVSFIRLTDGHYVAAADRLKWLTGQVLGAGPDQAFVQVREINDELGFTHYKYQQYYKGVKVEWGTYIVHVKNGRVVSANGEFYPEPSRKSLNVNPGIDKQAAFQKARRLFEAKEVNDHNPVNPLTVLCRGGRADLCYKYEISSFEPLKHEEVFVDARNGNIILELNKIHHTDVTGTVTTQYAGTKTITCDNYSTGSYRLTESTRNLYTKNCQNGSNMSSAVDFTNTSATWTASSNYDKAVFDLHYGLEKTRDYYSTKFSRNSWDNSGAQIKGIAHYSYSYNNAFWSNPYFVFGDGDGSSYTAFTPIDIVGHEFTHAVTESEAGLVYMNESGGLNESFSDIFGICVDYYAHPSTANFLEGEQCSTSGTPFRNTINPNATYQPDTYQGTYWVANNGPDNGGVHTNSQVQNHWFYLLVNGGTGVNDNSASYSVSGIGITDAEKIAYRNLTVYLTSNSTFANARTYAIQSAVDLYGACSNQVIQCTNAWHAVGVGNTFTNAVISQFSVNATYTCSTPGTFSFTNQSVNGTSYYWDFGDGSTSTSTNPTHTYTNTGVYSLKLKTSGTTSCNTVDSVIKTNYITVTNVGSPTTMCTPSQGSSSNSYGIVNVTFAGINNTSGSASEGYKDFTCSHQATLVAGNPYLLSVTVVSPSEYVYVWIDYNNNGSMGTGELIMASPSSAGIATRTLLVNTPVSATLNTPLRMRVFDDLYTVSSACQSHSYGQTEDYTLRFYASTSAPIANFFAAPKNLLVNTSAQFQDSSLNAPSSWKWTFQAGTPGTSTLQNPSVLYSSTGTYSVKLVVTNSYGADSVTKLSYITVHNSATMCVGTSSTSALSGVIYDSGGPSGSYNNSEYCSFLIDPGCTGTVGLTFSSFSTESGYDYLTVRNGSTSSSPVLGYYTGSTLPPTLYASSGKMYLQWSTDGSVVYSGFAATWNATVNGTSNPAANFTMSTLNPPLNTPVTFTDLTTNSPVQWSWQFGDGTFSTAQHPVKTYTTSGVKSITLTATNCTSVNTTVKTLTVQGAPTLSLSPSTFTGNMNCGDSLLIPFTVSNNGAGALSINGSVISAYDSIKVLVCTYGVDMSSTGEYVKTLNAISATFTRYSVSTYSGTSGTGLSSALTGKDVVLFPRQISNSDTHYSGFSTALNNFASAGGHVVMLGTYIGTTRPFTTGLFSGSYSGQTSGFTFSTATVNDSLIYGIGTTTISAPYSTSYYTISSTDKVPLGLIGTYDIVYYRPIGAGKAIVIGGDFYNTNTQMNYILGRAIKTARAGSTSNVSGFPAVINAPGSQTANIVIRTQGFPAGVYTSSLVLISNNTPTRQAFPITYTVNGQANATVSAVCVNNGTVMQHTKRLDSLIYSNSGCATLSVTSLSTGNAAYTFTPSTSFTLAPWTSRKIYLSFGSSVTGTYQDTLQINGNGGNKKICLNGVVSSAPAVTVSPQALSVLSPSCNGTQTANLTIYNSGGTNLNYTLSGQSTGQQVKVLAITNFVDMSTEYPNTISALNTYFTNYTVTQHYLSSLSSFTAALAGKDVLLIPEQESYYFGVMGTYSNAINSFVSAGGTAILLGTYNYQQVNEVGLFTTTSIGNNSSMTVIDTNDVIMDFIPLGSITAPNATFYGSFTNSGLQTFVTYGTYPVVTKRNIGLGRAIYMGFDYYAYTNQTARMLSNAVRSSLTGVNWLSTTTTTGVTAPGGTTTVTYTFNSQGLSTGVYTTNIIITTNDPLTPTVSVPVSYTVSGTATPSLSANCLNFGTLIQYTSKKDSVILFNAGCATMSVTALTVTTSAYSYTPSTSFTLAPGGSRKINVVFSSSVVGVYNDTLRIVTNGGTVKVCLNGTVLGAPVMSVVPNPIFVNSPQCNAVQNVTVTVSNTGGSGLTYTLGPPPGTGVKVLVITNFTDPYTEYPNTISALNWYFSNYTLTTHYLSNVSSFTSALVGKHVLLIPEQETYSTGFMQTYSTSIINFVSAGGTAILCGTGLTNQVNDIGLFNVSSTNYASNLMVVDTSDVIMQGLPMGWISANSSTWYSTFTNPGVSVFATNGTSPVVVKRQIGGGRAIYLGFDYYYYDQNSAKMIANSVKSSVGIPGWMTPASPTGSAAASNTSQIVLTFNSGGMATGTYTYDLVIRSNDPLTPTYTVPVTYSVYSGPSSSITPGCIDFGNLVQYQQKTDSVLLTNTGCGTLTLSTISATNTVFTYTPSSSFTLAPAASRKIYVTFKPMLAGAFADTLKLTGLGVNRKVCLTGTAIGAPEMTVLPPNVSFTLPACYGTQTMALQVYNSGGTPLTYTSPVTSAPWLSAPSVAGGSLAAGSTGTVYYTINTGSMSAGVYTVGLIAQSNGPMTPTYTVPVVLNITNNPCASFLVGNPNDCSGTVSFTNNVVNSVTSLNWNFGNGGTSTLPNPTYNYTLAGTYVVTLTACNGTMCSSTTRTLTISNVGGPQSMGCVVAASAPSASVGILNVKLNSINKSSGYANEGFKDFSCTDKTLLYSSIPYTMMITTSPLSNEDVAVYIDYDNNTLFSSTELVYSGQNGFITHTFVLTPPGSAVMNVPLRMRVLDEAASQVIGNACSNLVNGQAEDYAVTIKPGNLAPEVYFAAGSNGCNGIVAFTDNSNFYPTSWLWNFGDGNVSTLQNPVNTYTAPGTYTVSLIATNQYGSGFSTQTVTVSFPALSIITTGSLIPNSPVVFSSNMSNATAYNWNLGNGNLNGSPSPSATYTAPGTYTITLTVLSGTCMNTVSTVILIEEPVGIHEISTGRAYELRIFPNPFNRQTRISLELQYGGVVEMEIVNSLGQLIRTINTGELSAGPHTFDVNEIAAGLYYLRVRESGETRSFKLISVY